MKKKLLLFITAMCLVECGAKNETLKSTAPNIEETILANKVNVEGNTALYTMDEADMEGIIQSEIRRFGNDILMRYSYYSQEDQTSYTCFRILGIETGEIIYEAKLDEFMELKVQIIDEKIYAMEDRAGIFEYACMGLWKEMGLDDKKYNYYCEGIRKSFDTTGWPEQTLWEGQSK